jgi:catechol 2,3-dioxygenase-like lactoylglutathione lyase family enzyme
MAHPDISFDHVHLVSRDPLAAAQWYKNTLGADIVQSVQTKGAPQIYIDIGGGAMVIIRGQRPGESAVDPSVTEWGVDHFGVRIRGDFATFCGELKTKGVHFSLEPTDINPKTQIAFIDAPDGVSIELLNRKEALA